MSNLIENSAKCEGCIMIRFLHKKKLNVVEIHHQITEVYSKNVMRVNKVQKWCQEFTNGHTNIHDEDCTAWPSLITDELVQCACKKVCENRRFTVNELSNNFPEISLTVLYETLTEKLHYTKSVLHGYQKFLLRPTRSRSFWTSIVLKETNSSNMLSMVMRLGSHT